MATRAPLGHVTRGGLSAYPTRSRSITRELLSVLPRHQRSFEPPEELIEAVAQQADGGRTQQHPVDAKELAGVVDEEAEPALGRDELRGHDDEEREREAQAQSGQD